MGTEPVPAGFGDRTVGRQFAFSGGQGALRFGHVDQRTAVFAIPCGGFKFAVPVSRHARFAALRLAPAADRS